MIWKEDKIGVVVAAITFVASLAIIFLLFYSRDTREPTFKEYCTSICKVVNSSPEYCSEGRKVVVCK